MTTLADFLNDNNIQISSNFLLPSTESSDLTVIEINVLDIFKDKQGNSTNRVYLENDYIYKKLIKLNLKNEAINTILSCLVDKKLLIVGSNKLYTLGDTHDSKKTSQSKGNTLVCKQCEMVGDNCTCTRTWF